MYMNEAEFTIPGWVWYFSVSCGGRLRPQLAVSIYYTFDFILTFYLAPNKFAFLFSEYVSLLCFHSRPGLIDIITSFPILIIMIWMKLTGNVSSWIVKLPAFRIYILPPIQRCASPNGTSCDSFVPHVAAARNSPNSQRFRRSSHLSPPQILHSLPLLLMYRSPALLSRAALFQTLEHSEWAAQGLKLDMITSLSPAFFLA